MARESIRKRPFFPLLMAWSYAINMLGNSLGGVLEFLSLEDLHTVKVQKQNVLWLLKHSNMLVKELLLISYLFVSSQNCIGQSFIVKI